MMKNFKFNKFVTNYSYRLLRIFTVIGGLSVVAVLGIYFFDLSNIVDLNYLICMVNDSNTIKGSIEVNNVKINNLDLAVEKVRDGAIYIGGMTAAAKIMKGSSLPIGAKLGSVVGMGAASLVSYRMVQNNLRQTKVEGGLSMNADKVNTTISASKLNVNDSCINKLVADGNGADIFSISSLDIEQLQLDLYLHMIILYLFLLVFMFFLMKNISKRRLKFEFLEKLPFGSFIQTLLIKLFN